MRSISIWSPSPALRSPQVVTASVWGISSTLKQLPETLFTVSEVPSRQIEPFSAMKRASCAGASMVKRAVGPHSPAPVNFLARDDGRDAIDMTGDDMAAELVADLQGALQIERIAHLPGPRIVRASVSAATSTSNHEPPSRWPLCDHGEAGAVAGNRGAQRDTVGS